MTKIKSYKVIDIYYKGDYDECERLWCEIEWKDLESEDSEWSNGYESGYTGQFYWTDNYNHTFIGEFDHVDEMEIGKTYTIKERIK